MAHSGVLCSNWRGVRVILVCRRGILNYFGIFIVVFGFNTHSFPVNNNLTLQDFGAQNIPA